MAFKYSTGMRNAVLDSDSVKALLDGGFIEIYAGPAPASADDAIDGADHTLLVTISEDAGAEGLNFDTAASEGQLLKDPGQTWSGTIEETGSASFFRFVTSTDTGAESTSEVRIQGGIGTSGADMNLATTSLTETETQVIDQFSMSVPTP